ncbi:MAG TPA: ATP synthase F1 subunit delta [Actinomycetota bacterium]|nr:ATP synthase F1 subunit delta [Actinomycetota bacterium]
MAGDEAVRGYAQALLSIAEAEGVLDRVEDELYAFAQSVERHADLREALTDEALPPERKKAVIDELLGARGHPLTATMIGFLVDAGQARRIGPIAGELAREAAHRSERTLAEARVAVPLTDPQRRRLEEALTKATGRPVELKVVVDPSVIGGVVARVGDEVFDGSVASRLADARQYLIS